jgi:hypothetical protein
LQYWGLNSGLLPWVTLPAPPPHLFVMGIFKIGSQELFAQGWLQMTILISASWIARISDMSHWYLAIYLFIFNCILPWSSGNMKQAKISRELHYFSFSLPANFLFNTF